MINEITDQTNQKSEKVEERYKSKKDTTEASSSGILAVLGIIIISGALQASHQDIEGWNWNGFVAICDVLQMFQLSSMSNALW